MGLTLIETIIAFVIGVVIGGIILSIINYLLEGPRLKITSYGRQDEKKSSLTYRHLFSVQNNGKTTGRVLNIIVEPNEVKPSKIIDLDNDNKTMVARFNIDGKKIRNLAIDCEPLSDNTKYTITVKYEKSFLRKTSKEPQIIWPIEH